MPNSASVTAASSLSGSPDRDRPLRRADGRVRAGKATAAITFGHNKDHRPDLKQLVWILTVSTDGAVPLAHRVVDGNTSDDVTHIDTWDHLVALLGRADFLYVADCKLATRDNMDHIHRRGGRFVSVLPASRKEDSTFGTGSSTTSRTGSRPRGDRGPGSAPPTRSGTPPRRPGHRPRATASATASTKPRSPATPPPTAATR
ncbi:MAG: hypothetical protein ACRDTK_07595 [Mycobacterium sp.]